MSLTLSPFACAKAQIVFHTQMLRTSKTINFFHLQGKLKMIAPEANY